MCRQKISDQEWEMFLDLADRLGFNVRGLLKADVRFTELESAGHQLGRVVATATTERLSLARAEQMESEYECPTCGKRVPAGRKQRTLETIDGPIELAEPSCECPACRRAFFPSASRTGT